jgi:fumarylacetoacetase
VSGPVLDATHDPTTGSWVPTANDHPDFPIQNLPLCIFTAAGETEPLRRGGIRVGEYLLDLAALTRSGLLSGAAQVAADAAAATTLNDLFALGRAPRVELRAQVHGLLAEHAGHTEQVATMLHPVADCYTHLPARVGDYTDFYAGIHHARRVGALFRPDDPLLPNYKWVPIGYHGRASTVQISGQPVRRPHGQLKEPDGAPVMELTRRLDFELELGIWLSGSPTPGHPVPIGRAGEQIAGFCLLNDWSARDVQSWEYQPLGPFLAKSFATSVSGYVVTPEALAPYPAALVRPADDPQPLSYLADESDLAGGAVDVRFEVALSSARMRHDGRADLIVSRSSATYLYWTVAQLITHHSSNGCELQAGDLLGSGTVSSPDDDGLGSLMELTVGGGRPLLLPTGEQRTFLLDGDEVVLRGRASRPGAAPVGFGECRARIVGDV